MDVEELGPIDVIRYYRAKSYQIWKKGWVLAIAACIGVGFNYGWVWCWIPIVVCFIFGGIYSIWVSKKIERLTGMDIELQGHFMDTIDDLEIDDGR